MELSLSALVVLGLLMAAWIAGAAWYVFLAQSEMARAKAILSRAQGVERILEEAPAIPLLVRSNGRIEGSDRLALWLGLRELPANLSDLQGTPLSDTGLDEVSFEQLENAVQAAQRTAQPFSFVMHPIGSDRTLAVHGYLADPSLAGPNAAIVWWFDFTRYQSVITEYRQQAEETRADFSALLGVIEAAPMPMWFRSPDAQLRLVNSAYTNAVGASSPQEVIARQIELVEPVDGQTAGQVALDVQASMISIERVVQATIGTQRRTLRVSDLPLNGEGVAGYAVDIEEMEEQARAFRAFRLAQRSMLDRLSIGVAQFDADRMLSYANQPFQRIFALGPDTNSQTVEFDRFLDDARNRGRLPEVRDFPAWRKDLGNWFNADTASEAAWSLSDGTHLRIVAQPMPDGGIVLVAEDRSEQLALSAMRDTLLRTRTATFDSLFEALAVFAPDGRIKLWNRRFPEIWDLSEDFFEENILLEPLLEQIGRKLDRPSQRSAIEEVVRVATLDRKQRSGRVLLSDGRTLEFAGVPLPDGNSLLTLMDVTDRKKAEDALRDRAHALEMADAVKTRFLANVSYEFRTPLTSIQGFAEMLQSGMAGELSQRSKEYVDAIIASAMRLNSEIDRVIDMTQSEAGLLPIVTDEVDLMPFVTAIVRDREEALEQKGLTLDLRGDKNAGSYQIDRAQMGRAIGNLLDSAIEVSPEGGRVHVSLIRRSGITRLTVRDEGEGMKPSELARAMEGILHLQDSEGVKSRIGLGFPLARKLIEAHGGKLVVHSEKGSGTTATITLP